MAHEVIYLSAQDCEMPQKTHPCSHFATCHSCDMPLTPSAETRSTYAQQCPWDARVGNDNQPAAFSKPVLPNSRGREAEPAVSEVQFPPYVGLKLGLRVKVQTFCSFTPTYLQQLATGTAKGTLKPAKTSLRKCSTSFCYIHCTGNQTEIQSV